MSALRVGPGPSSRESERARGHWTPEVRQVAAVFTAALLTLVAGIALTGPSTASGRAAGLSDAGWLTPWLLPASRALFDLTAIGTVGVLTALAWLVPPDREDARRRLRRVAAAWALSWSLAALLLLLMSVSQVVGRSLLSLLTIPDLLLYGVDLPQGRATGLVVVGALALGVWIPTVRTSTGLRAWSVVAPAMLAPLLATGHAATSSNHVIAIDLVLVHVGAVTLWMGGVLALVVHLRGFPTLLPVAVHRFSRLALACYLAVAATGLVSAYVRMGVDPQVWRSAYGVLLLAKTALLVGLGVFGWWHRRRTLVDLSAGRPGAFLRIAGEEIALMAVAVGVAVVLARTAPPIAAALRGVPPHAARYPTIDATLGPFTPVTALLETRPDALLLLSVLIVGALLLMGVRALRPGRRSVLLVSGVLLAGWSLAGGLGAYSTVLLSAQTAQVLVLAVVVPPLVAWGLPPRWRTTLLAHVDRPGLRILFQPTNAVVVLMVGVAVLFWTPLLDLSLRSELGHVLVAVAALAVGLALFVPMAARPGDRAGTVVGLLVLAVSLAAYGALLRSAGGGYAGGWFRDVDLWWADPVADQRTAGWVTIGFAVALAGFAGLLSRPARD